MRKKFGHIFKYNKLRSFGKEDVKALIAYGNYLFQEGKHEKALEYYNEAMAIRASLDIQDDVSLTSTLYKMSTVYDELGKAGLATIYHDRAACLSKMIRES